MNNKGLSIYTVMFVAFFAFLIIPTVLFYLFSTSKILFQIIMAFMIIAYVKNFGIDGPLLWLFSGILIYFLDYKYVEVTATLYMLIIMIGMGFTSAIIWGSSLIKGKIETRMKKN